MAHGYNPKSWEAYLALKACLKQTSLSEKDAEEMRGIQVQSQTDCKAQLSTG